MNTLPPNPVGIRVLKSVESDRLKKDYDSTALPPTPAQCITCGGTKTFRWYDDRDEIIEFRCRCDAQWVLHRYFLFNGIGVNYQRIGWRQVFAEVDQDAISTVKRYLENLSYNVRVGTGLYLYGEPGTGKTLLSTLLLKGALAQGHSGHFTTFLELKDAYVGAWKDSERADWYKRKIRNTGLLVIDDPGRESNQSEKGVDFARNILDDVIRARMSASLPTVITSNMDPDGFRTLYGGHVASLLDEHMLLQSVTGGSFRHKKGAEMLKENKLQLTRPVVIG